MLQLYTRLLLHAWAKKTPNSTSKFYLLYSFIFNGLDLNWHFQSWTLALMDHLPQLWNHMRFKIKIKKNKSVQQHQSLIPNSGKLTSSQFVSLELAICYMLAWKIQPDRLEADVEGLTDSCQDGRPMPSEVISGLCTNRSNLMWTHYQVELICARA